MFDEKHVDEFMRVNGRGGEISIPETVKGFSNNMNSLRSDSGCGGGVWRRYFFGRGLVNRFDTVRVGVPRSSSRILSTLLSAETSSCLRTVARSVRRSSEVVR